MNRDLDDLRVVITGSSHDDVLTISQELGFDPRQIHPDPQAAGAARGRYPKCLLCHGLYATTVYSCGRAMSQSGATGPQRSIQRRLFRANQLERSRSSCGNTAYL
jgi:hypothetical protein